jgi:GNAT superfamily N-acetyltransferase
VKIEQFTSSDIPLLPPLQPDGWLPLGPYYHFYVTASYCHPVKCTVDGSMVGIGSCIRHRTTGWLAHIIVAPEYRRRGIGTLITKWLMTYLTGEWGMKTLHLVATPMGEPVYRRLGFRRISDYLFMRGGKTDSGEIAEILPFDDAFRDAGLKMDADASFEDRSQLLEPHWSNGCFILNNGALAGFFLPTLGEGYILATCREAGLALMRLKHGSGATAIVPEQNPEAVRYLTSSGYAEYRRGIRMVYGEPLPWRPEMIYGRIGGNLG